MIQEEATMIDTTVEMGMKVDVITVTMDVATPMAMIDMMINPHF
jgi:hypothetical protein